MNESPPNSLRDTPLLECHVALGARLGDFAGWRLPLSYGRVSDEVLAVRHEMGVFDVSHLAQIRVTGRNATPFLESVLTNAVTPVQPGRAVYSLLCTEQGGVIDDLLAYRFAESEWLCVVNASRAETDAAWLESRRQGEVGLSLEWRTLIAVQGPLARTLIAGLLVEEAALLPRNGFLVRCENEGEIMIACTGYTGEDGFEISVPPEAGPALWNRLVDAQATPCGLAARDVLRLEAALPLSGHEWTEDRSPYACGYGWAVKLDKGEFVGKEALQRVAEQGPDAKLIGLELADRVVPRNGYDVLAGGEVIGQVSSGTFSPTLERSIALAFVRRPTPSPGEAVSVRVRGKLHDAEVVGLPFYRSDSA